MAAAGLLFVQSGVGKAAVFLTVNGEDPEPVVFVEVGKPLVIEIVSNDNNPYGFVIGFQESSPSASLEHIETKPEAGTEAWIEPWEPEYGPPAACGYCGQAVGGTSAGPHFVFQYRGYGIWVPVVLGLWLWDSGLEDFYQVDAVTIIALPPPPPPGACCDALTGNCYISTEWDCAYTWLGAGTDCSMCEPLPLTVSSPNGGECLLANTTYTVTWSGAWSIDEILIEYSTDNGQNWDAFTTVANSGSYNWPVPAVDSNECLVRISDVLNPGVSDTSDLVFSIESVRYSGGTGEPNNPYRIATAEDLNDIGNYEEDWDKYFILVNDVNLAEFTGTQFNIIGRWVESGDDPNSKPFTGVFDGNDRKIYSFTWNSTDNRKGIGLFGYVGLGGQIKNLGMANVDVYTADGWYVGGLVGYNGGTIGHCYSAGSIRGHWCVGGLVGYNDSGTVTECYSTGSVFGGEYVGGLAGSNRSVPRKANITNCYSTSSVIGFYVLGGLTGENYAAGTSWTSISNCYSTGIVGGIGDVGGLIGRNDVLTRVLACFWDVETSDCNTSAGGTPTTTAEMKTKATFTDAGWDFNDVWAICEGRAYPHLLWQGISFPCFGDMVDFALFGEAWGSGPNDADWNAACNLYQDDSIDIFDAALFCDLWLGSERTFPVPDVVDMNQTDAHSALVAGHLMVGDEVFDYNETVPQFVVLSQDPAAGTVVRRFTEVDLAISNGPCPKVAMPDVVDMSEAEAEAAIGSVGLTVEKNSEPNATVPAGRVIRQDPVAGTLVCVGSNVDLSISLGFLPSGFVLIPGGQFMMGDGFGTGEPDQRPVHPVYVDSFGVSKYEVTCQEYRDFLNSAKLQGTITVGSDKIVYKSGTSIPYCATLQYSTSVISRINWDGNTFTVTSGKESHPMGMVTWYGAAAYCNWLSEKEDLQTCYDSSWNCDIEKVGYRLPTEAEWEYADRAGVAGCKYPFCNDCNNIAGSKANYWGSGDPYESASYPYTTPVGFYNGQLHEKSDMGWPGSQATYQTSDGSNCYGLYDMAGNVWEWCNDWYSDTYYEECNNAYPILPYPNPEGPASSEWKVVRGGGWGNNDFRATAASRSYTGAVICENDNLGFRVVLRLE